MCHEPLWEETRDKHASYFSPAGLIGLGGKWLGAMARLTRRFGPTALGAEWVVAGFNGQLDVLLARRLAGRRRVLFAPLVTVTETLVDDRAQYREASPLARVFKWIDRAGCDAADLVLADTKAHAEYLRRRIGVSDDKILVQYLGAEECFGRAPLDAPAGRPLRVLGYGSYLPLHGYDVVAEALRRLEPSDGIEIELIGSGPERARVEERVRDLGHVRLVDWLPYEELPGRIEDADVVLGIFGSSAKAEMVIPNKVYQAAQVGRPILTADTPAIREVFEPGESIITVSSAPEAVADALRALSRDEGLRRRLGAAAHDAVRRVAGPDARAARLREALARSAGMGAAEA